MLNTLSALLVTVLVFHATISLAAISPDQNDRLESCEPRIAISAAEEIITSPATLNDPSQFFAPLVAFFRHGMKDEAVFWYYTAQLRTRDQAASENPNAGLLTMGITMAMASVGPAINNYAYQDVSNFIRILDRVTAWNKRTPNPYPVLVKEKLAKVDLGIAQLFADLRDKNARFIQERAPKESPAWLAAMEMRFQTEAIDPAFVELKAKLTADTNALESKARLAAPVIELANPKLFSYCRTQ